MPRPLADSLAIAFSSDSDGHDDTASLLSEVLESYSPSTLKELYIAVRAQCSENNRERRALVDGLHEASMLEPELPLVDFAKRDGRE